MRSFIASTIVFLMVIVVPGCVTGCRETAVDPQVQELKELFSKYKEAEDEGEKREIVEKIADIFPEFISEFGEDGEPLDINEGFVEDYLRSQGE